MQKQAINTNETQNSEKWGYKVFLYLLLITFNTSGYASLDDNSNKYLTTQKSSDAAFILNLSSSISEAQADEPEFEKATNVVSKTFQNFSPITFHFQTRIAPSVTKWNWHLVRAPPIHL